MSDQDQWRLLPKWFDSVISRYTGLAIVLSVGAATLTSLFNPTVGIENIRALLTTIAIIEASILAIVFSVTVVALQLVVTRYSARLTSIFVEEPLFQVTFGLFIIGIAFNLLFLYLLPVQVSRLTNAAIEITFALAAVSTIALYRFILLMIQRGSPDELISVLIERKLIPEKYLPENSSAFQEMDAHPIRPLYQTLSRANELGEYQTAEQGIKGIRTVLTRTFEYLETEYSDVNAAEYAAIVSSEVFTEYIPSILEQLYSHEQYDLIETTISDMEAAALDGFNRGFTGVIEAAAEGLGDAFDAAPQTWEGNRLRRPIKETLLELTKATAKDGDYQTFLSVFHELQFQLTILLRRRSDPDITERLVGNYYSVEVMDIFQILIDRYGPTVQDKNIDWISPTENRKTTLPDEAKPLRHFWREYANFSETVLRYRLSKEEYPFAEGSLHEGWRKIIRCAADSGLHNLATLCCMSAIEIVYHVDQFEDGSYGLWTNTLGHLRLDYDPKIVDQAFKHLKAGERPEGQNISVQIDTSPWMDTEESVIGRILDTKEENKNFGEWVEGFERQVHERTEYLREK